MQISDRERAISEELLRRGLSVDELGRKAGLSRPTVRKAIAGGNVTLRTMARICKALNLPADIFLPKNVHGEDEKEVK